MADKKQELREAQEALARQERTTGQSGAVPRMPKEAMLDASDVQAQHPDKHLRWVNTRNAEKAESRKLEGYERLSEAEGGRALGTELALFAIPKARHDARVREQNERSAALMTAHRAEVERAAESAARELRDRHGVRVRERDLIINEER